MALCAIITTIAYPTLEAESIGIKNLFKLFSKDADLIDCEIIAIDGTFCEISRIRSYRYTPL
jgi:uncharacterized ubiquitin-like protein YukD